MIRILFFRDIFRRFSYTLTPMRIFRNLFLFSLTLSLIWGVTYSYIQVTDGFSLRQMTSSLPPCPQYEVALNGEKLASLEEILAQPFSYLGKGCQFYAFESKDGKYVIKFLKHKHLRPYTWLERLPLPANLRARSQAKIERRQERVEKLFSSCKLAYEEMQEETGLVYIHLHRTPATGKRVTLTDRIGRLYQIDIDHYEFVVQKRALSVEEVFEKIQSQEELASRVEQLMDVIKRRAAKGIADRDRSFVQNVGFTLDGSQAVFVDTGQFFHSDEVLRAEGLAKDLEKRLHNLRHWTERHFPKFRKEVESYSSSSFSANEGSEISFSSPS